MWPFTKKIKVSKPDNISELQILSALKDLRRQDDAQAHFEYLAGAYYWDDELPHFGNLPLFTSCNLYLRKAFAYRHSLSLHKPRCEFEENWKLLNLSVPSWPGFSVDRIYGRASRMAKITQRKMERSLAEMERDFDKEAMG